MTCHFRLRVVSAVGRPRNPNRSDDGSVHGEGGGEEKERKKGKTGRAISVGGPRDRDSTEPNYRVGRCSVLSRGGERNTGQDTPATFLSTTVADILDACSEQPPAVVGRMVVNLSYEACVGSADNRPPLSSVRFVYIYIYTHFPFLSRQFFQQEKQDHPGGRGEKREEECLATT